jgi:hypothetical protein
MGALRYRMRFSRSRRVETLDNYNLSDALSATSNVGSRRLRSRSSIKHRANSPVFYGLPSLVPLSRLGTDILPKLQADINERVNSLRFAKLAPTFSNRTRAESRRIASRSGLGDIAFLASDSPTSGRLDQLRDKFLEDYDAVFRVAVCRIFGLSSPHILSNLRPPLIACVFCHLFKLCGMRSRWRLLTCWMMRGLMLLIIIWLDAADVLRSTPLTLGW